MVGVVKWLRHRIVIPACVGSNPTIHPITFSQDSSYDIGVSPSGKATDSDSVIRRFESCYPSQQIRQSDCIALPNSSKHEVWWHSQVVRRRSAKPLFPGSNPGVASKNEFPMRTGDAEEICSSCIGEFPLSCMVDDLRSVYLGAGCGGYSQVVKTAGCGSVMRGFESHYPPH